MLVEGVPSVVLKPESEVGVATMNGLVLEETVVTALSATFVAPLEAAITFVVGPPMAAVSGIRAKTVLLSAPLAIGRMSEEL